MTDEQIIAAARVEWYRLRESGKSPNADPERYYRGLTEFVLATTRRLNPPEEVK